MMLVLLMRPQPSLMLGMSAVPMSIAPLTSSALAMPGLGSAPALKAAPPFGHQGDHARSVRRGHAGAGAEGVEVVGAADGGRAGAAGVVAAGSDLLARRGDGGHRAAVHGRAAAAEAGDRVDAAGAVVDAGGGDDQVLGLFGGRQRAGSRPGVAGREDLDERLGRRWPCRSCRPAP